MLNYWLVKGIILIILEFLVPGAISVFLGISALTVWGAVYFGIIEGWYMAFLMWCMISVLYLFVLRSFFMKFFPAEIKVHETDEEYDAQGKIVEVTEDITPEKSGRISLSDSTWAAYSDVSLKKGDKAMIQSRHNLGWIVTRIQ